MTSATNDELLQFFGAYFHQDWDLDDKEPNDVIARFASGMQDAPQRLTRLADLIEQYVGERPDENELDAALFAELGCSYLPSADGLSATAWMRSVASQLREFAARSR